MTDAIVEVRDYTINEADFPAYRDWAIQYAAPWLKANLDVIDFWVDVDIQPELSGSDPDPSKHGAPNVCWILRWPSRDAREAGFQAFVQDPGWQEVWAKHPNPDAYLEVNVRFMQAATDLA